MRAIQLALSLCCATTLLKNRQRTDSRDGMPVCRLPALQLQTATNLLSAPVDKLARLEGGPYVCLRRNAPEIPLEPSPYGAPQAPMQ